MRGPDLPDRIDGAQKRRMDKAIKSLEVDELDTGILSDHRSARLTELVARKLDSGEGVVRAPEDAEPSEQESAEVIDLMEVLKRSLGESGERRASSQRKAPKRTRSKTPASARTESSGKGPRSAPRREQLESRSKAELYDQAKDLDIAGRSGMSKDELIDAISSAR